MKLSSFLPTGLGLIALLATPARADELFGGVYAHDLHIVAVGGTEHGTDFELGWRGGSILPILGGPHPHVFVSANSAGGTHFAAAGIDWRIGSPFYVRPGIGIAVHTGPGRPGADRIWFGSRVLFEPEIGIGVRLPAGASVEASWVHLSHANIAGRQNPGLDTVGLRFNYRFR
ncbi:MAG TPA: acyloxyacyl hydrolase [Allosphingosinicella sp.]|jgi:hypothetical protein|nr:acyloxyacyl hydrolase [Allosphingosinicella sp.]